MKDFYNPDDLTDFNYDQSLGKPGKYPFTRGIYPTMYKGRLWTMRQYAGFGDAKETNQRFCYLLEKGQTGLSVAFDLPTQLGYDSDSAPALGEVGKVGVAISTIDDMVGLFAKIPLDKVSTSMTINATAPMIMAMYIVNAQRNGISCDKLSGTVQNDILKEYVARGNYIFPVRQSLKLTMDIWEYCIKNMPKWYMVSISGYHIREAGATAIEELAFTIADGIAYVEAALERGLKVDDFGPRLSFFFGCHNNFLEEVAKFRAGRRVWARIMKERFKAQDLKSQMLRFHTQTCGSTLTAQQPENNAIRVALQALAAALGGTQSLHTNSFDEALALPTQKAVTLALRTQQIIGYESGVADVVDPLGGSYYLERMTDEIEAGVMDLLKTIETQGGAVPSIENGYIQRKIEESAYRYQKEVECGNRKIVGVNTFTEPEKETEREILKITQKLADERKQKLEYIRKKREKTKIKQYLDSLANGAQKNDNLMSFLIDAVGEGATLEELCNVLRQIWGEYDVKKS